MSFIYTRTPLYAANWPIPPPMIPAPSTPRTWILPESFFLGSTPRPFRAASLVWNTCRRFLLTEEMKSSAPKCASAARLSEMLPLRCLSRMSRIRNGAGKCPPVRVATLFRAMLSTILRPSRVSSITLLRRSFFRLDVLG